jgi:hypothetical protein
MADPNLETFPGIWAYHMWKHPAKLLKERLSGSIDKTFSAFGLHELDSCQDAKPKQ